jgi:hypothetical protein
MKLLRFKRLGRPTVVFKRDARYVTGANKGERNGG